MTGRPTARRVADQMPLGRGSALTEVDARVHEQLLGEAVAEPPGPARIAALVRADAPLLSAAEVDAAVRRISARVCGLGPLEVLFADPDVSDVLVNGPGPVWVERRGRVEVTEIVLDRSSIDVLVERIVAPLGRRVDPASPVVDGRLPDGSRIHVVVPPLAIDGPCLAIRRFAARRIDVSDVAPSPVDDLLRWMVRSRANLLIAGGTGSGKTTLLNALAAEVPPGERIITVEDAAELRLPSDHVVRLETRPASVEGVPEVSCRDLVRSALRMRPDRLVVGEVRGGEALDMVQAMNTGHDGSLSTIHANGCEDALRRLETLVLFAGVGLPLDAVREHLASAVDVVVHLTRDPTGRRRVTEVAEVLPPGIVRASGADASAGPMRRATRLLADGQRVHFLPERAAREPGAGPPPDAWCQR